MARVLIRDLSERTVERLKARAERNGRSLQAELRIIVERAAAADILRRHGPRSQLRVVLREWAAILVDQQRHPEAVTLLTEASADA